MSDLLRANMAIRKVKIEQSSVISSKPFECICKSRRSRAKGQNCVKVSLTIVGKRRSVPTTSSPPCVISLGTLLGGVFANPGTTNSATLPETLDRLEPVVIKQGLSVFARIDFSGDAEKAGLKMNPSQLLIFGNPKAGTPLDDCLTDHSR